MHGPIHTHTYTQTQALRGTTERGKINGLTFPMFDIWGTKALLLKFPMLQWKFKATEWPTLEFLKSKASTESLSPVAAAVCSRTLKLSLLYIYFVHNYTVQFDTEYFRGANCR